MLELAVADSVLIFYLHFVKSDVILIRPSEEKKKNYCDKLQTQHHTNILGNENYTLLPHGGWNMTDEVVMTRLFM